MHGSDVGVIEPRKCQRFVTKTTASAAVGQRTGRKDFHSDIAVELQVMRAIHDAHSSGTNLLCYPIVPEGVPDTG